MKTTRSLITGTVLFITCLLMHGHAVAAPYWGKEFLFKQPDNSEVKVLAWGDEFYQRVESPDGYTLIRDSITQWICYARLNAAGTDFISTGIHYDGITAPPTGLPKKLQLSRESILAKRKMMMKKLGADKSKARVGHYDQPDRIVQGTFKGLTLLVDFSDQPAAIPQSEINNYFNQPGYSGYGNNGSVRDYFYDVSGGKVTYTNQVTAYYRAQFPKSHYDHPTEGKPRDLIIEALNHLEAQGFDFHSVSLTGNEMIALNVFYAGYPSQGWLQGLWPHASYLGHAVGGVIAGSYEITNIGLSLELGTMCHENGHMLMKWPDLYDYGGESAGAGNYCLMAYQGPGHNPVPPNPHFRAIAGWQILTTLNNAANNSVHTIAANTLSGYRYNNTAQSQEYFIVENIRQEGRWAGMPDEGMAIWHIEEMVGNNSNEHMTTDSHYLVSLEQADGKFDLERWRNAGTQGDFFHGSYRNAFAANTIPNSNWWSGQASGLNLLNISSKGNSMSFSIVKNDLNNSITTYQAENQTWSQAIFENTNGGYTGTGYVNTNNVSGSYVEFTVNVPVGKTYTVNWRYANGTTANRSVSVRVNNTAAIANLPANGTGAWTTWREEPLSLVLIAGTNKIRFTALTSNGAPNIDKIDVLHSSPNQAPVISQPLSPITMYVTDQPRVINLANIFSDPENDYMFFSASLATSSVVTLDQPAANTLHIVTLGYESGQNTINIRATDIYNNTTIHQVQITVLPNQYPVLTKNLESKVLCVDGLTYKLDLDTCFVDPDNDPLTFVASTQNPGLNLNYNATTHVLEFIPNAEGRGYVIIEAKDDKNAGFPNYVFVAVHHDNRSPVVDNPIPDIILYHTQVYRFNPSDRYSDPDNDWLTIRPVNLDARLEYEIDDEYWELTTNVVSSGPIPVRLKITDNNLCGTPDTYDEFTVTVRENHPPVIISPVPNKSITTTSAAIQIDLDQVFSDPDGHAINFYVVQNNMGSTYATQYTYDDITHVLSISGILRGEDEYVLNAYDHAGSSTVSTAFRVVVSEPNRPPFVAAPLPDRSLLQNSSIVNINLNSHFADPDNDVLVFNVTGGGGNLSLSGSTLVINPRFAGSFIVRVDALDNRGGIIFDEFNLTVTTAPLTVFCFEAESAIGQPAFSPYQVMNDANASGGKYIVVPNGTGNQSSPPTNSIASYSFSVSTSGTYNVWVRILAPTSNDNNCYMRMDNSSFSSWTPGTYSTWTWKKWTSRSMSAGSHSVSIARNRDGLQIDKILVTKSTSTPSGTGCGSAEPEADTFVANAPSAMDEADMSVMPNPTADNMTVSIRLKETSTVKIALYNMIGEEAGVIANGVFSEGTHQFDYKAMHVAPGVYLLRMTTPSGSIIKRIIKN